MAFSEQASRRIVIVTQTFDPHADELLTLLRYMGEEPLRLNTDAIPGNSLISYTFARQKLDDAARLALPTAKSTNLDRYTLFIDGRMIEADEVGAIWWRRPAPYQFIGKLQPEELSAATAETEQAMQALWLALSAQGCYWMSTPEAIRCARNRPEQVRRAHSHGLATPRSLLTTRGGHLRTFYQETGGRVVFRMLSTPEIHQRSQQQEGNALVSEDLLAAFESMVSVPCFFQERLEASRFFQVVVIGERVFVARTTGELSSIAHWWSSETSTLSYEIASLPEHVEEHCRAFVHSYGLEFGVMQLALGPDEQIFFVSLDPTGSFLWLEQQCPDLAMSETLAKCLIAGSEKRSNNE